MNQRFMKMTFWLALAALATTLGWSRLPAGRAGQVYVDHPELRPSQVPNGRARHVYGDPPDNCSWRRLTTGSLVIEDYEVDLHQDWVHFPLTGYPSDEVLNGFPSKYLLQIEARPLPVVQELPPANTTIAAITVRQVHLPFRVASWRTVELRAFAGRVRLPVEPRLDFLGILFSLMLAASLIALLRGAIRLIRQYARSRAGRCTQCGYPVAASTHRCPECGAEYTTTPLRSSVAV